MCAKFLCKKVFIVYEHLTRIQLVIMCVESIFVGLSFIVISGYETLLSTKISQITYGIASCITTTSPQATQADTSEFKESSQNTHTQTNTLSHTEHVTSCLE